MLGKQINVGPRESAQGCVAAHTVCVAICGRACTCVVRVLRGGLQIHLKRGRSLTSRTLNRSRISCICANCSQRHVGARGDEWEALPEPGAHTKYAAAEKRNERFFTPMPDSLLEKARMENEVHTSLDTKQMANAQGGMETPMGMQVGLRRHAPYP